MFITYSKELNNKKKATEIKNPDKNKVNCNNNTQQPQEQRESKMSEVRDVQA